uniref:Helicase SKI2W n=1 Tax=Schistosoma mansoni TaxID=6183 RepID=A0A5K4F7S9_SCHMA
MSHLTIFHAFLDHSFPQDNYIDSESGYERLARQDVECTSYEAKITRECIGGQLNFTDLFCENILPTERGVTKFGGIKTEAAIVSAVEKVRDSVFNKLGSRLSHDRSVLRPGAIKYESAGIDAVLDASLPIISHETLADWIGSTEISTSSSSNTERLNYGKRVDINRKTKELLEKRFRNSKPQPSYICQEDTTCELPPLTELVDNPAFNWEFELDTFQKQAILCLERNQTVFVAAHTSAGKTVVAEYACALCRRRGTRVIYTSPIKALSNQKFYDFRQTFGDSVGLITGDIKLAPESTILIMTTEILHNMLCNDADVIRDLEIVIMDEVHYVNDVERGHIWEQIMIMLPKHVLLVMLSATVPNKLDFADWLGRIRGTEVHVVATNKRPVPLEHFLFTGMDSQRSKDHLHLIVDQAGQFNLSGYKQANRMLSGEKDVDKKKPTETPVNPSSAKNAPRKNAGGKVNTPGHFRALPPTNGISVHDHRTKNLWLGVIHLLQDRDLMPTIAFAFSRSSLETLAGHLSSVDLLNSSEKQQVKNFLHCSVTKRLKRCDRQLASVQFISKLAVRGLAVHHAGMLPILKETVEMLFRRGLIRILFATETFAMGVNMPARCVIFTTLEKFDGQKRRPLNSSEYTQMAGRAGRRGLDASGSVIILLGGIGKSLTPGSSGLPSEHTLSDIILGKQTQLVSKFKITYSMILHLHRTNWLTPQDVMRRSFMEAANLRRELDRKQWLSALRKKLDETTTLIPPAGLSSNIPHQTARSSNSKVTISMNNNSRLSVPIGEPILQVKCPFGQISCCDAMTTYYQACCNYQKLTSSIVRLLSEENLTDLQRVFCPGRIVFIHLPQNDNSLLYNKVIIKQPNWLVPGVLVNLTKKKIKNGSEIECDIITWELSNLTNHSRSFQKCNQSINHTDSVNDINGRKQGNINNNANQFNELDEEDILKEGEDAQLSNTPYPPQLMPVYTPEVSIYIYIYHERMVVSKLFSSDMIDYTHRDYSQELWKISFQGYCDNCSLEDGYARLTLLSNLSIRSFVRITDHVFTVQQYCNNTVNNANITSSELLLRGIKRHRQQIAAKQAGMHLVIGSNSTASDCDPLVLMDELNANLFNLVISLMPESSMSPMFGLPANWPTKVDLRTALKFKGISEEDACVFDEHALLSDELTTPLLTSVITQRLAPISCPDLVAHLELIHRTCRRRWAVKRIEDSLSNSQLQLNTEYVGRLCVLEELGFIDSATHTGCLSLKGRIACELTKMEVLITQLLLNGSFTDLSAPDLAAVLSCFVFETRSTTDAEQLQQHDGQYLHSLLESLMKFTNDDCNQNHMSNSCSDVTSYPSNLIPALQKIVLSAIELEQLQTKYGLTDPSMDTRITLQVVNAVFAWAQGYSFSSLVSMTSVPEGHLVRGLLQLDELLHHICNACHHLGDRNLSLRMKEARSLILRDLVCAPSLYTADDLV